MFYCMLLIYAVTGSSGLVLIKKELTHSGLSTTLLISPAFYFGFLLYGGSFAIWIRILKDNDLTIAFPIASAALFLFISVLSSFVLKENVGPAKICGMITILVGIAVVSRG